MKCKEAKKLLSQYTDGILDPGVMGELKSHLGSCESCSKALEALLEMRRRFDLLPEVDAPDDFLQRLHERLDREPVVKRIAKKLFFPLGRKIPLELAAAVSMALVVILLLQALPVSRFKPTLPEETSPMERLPEEVGQAELSEKPPENTAGAPLPAEHEQKIEKARVSEKPREEPEKIIREPEMSEIVPQKAPAIPEPESLEKPGLKVPAEAPHTTDVRIFLRVVQAEQEEKPVATTMAKKSISEQDMEYGSAREIELILELVNRYSGSVVNGESQDSITFEIPMASYAQFLEDLGKYGQYRLETLTGRIESTAGIEGSTETITVSIELTK